MSLAQEFRLASQSPFWWMSISSGGARSTSKNEWHWFESLNFNGCGSQPGKWGLSSVKYDNAASASIHSDGCVFKVLLTSGIQLKSTRDGECEKLGARPSLHVAFVFCFCDLCGRLDAIGFDRRRRWKMNGAKVNQFIFDSDLKWVFKWVSVAFLDDSTDRWR